MNCRTFHGNLEDYLQEGLDYPGRFGMERHAQQCLRQMVSELERVKAPSNFETSVLRAIASRRTHSRFSSLQRFWFYGFEWPLWRKLALASSSIAIIGLVIFYASSREIPGPASSPSPVASVPAKIPGNPPKTLIANTVKEKPVVNAKRLVAKPAAIPETLKVAETNPLPDFPDQGDFQEDEVINTEYVEYPVIGPDNRPVPIRLPKRIRMQYGPTSQESYIRNVSH
jgi:hypothetical protein